MINWDLLHAIREIYMREEAIDNLFFVNKVPRKKLANAVKSYADNMGQDEQIIFLYDDTIFGSAKEGFILTTHALYSKNSFLAGNSAKIDEILRMTYDEGGWLRVLSIKVQTEHDDFEMHLTQVHDSSKKNALFNVLNQTVQLLCRKTDFGVESKNSFIKPVFSPHCVNCGAPVSRGARKCEYCDTSL